MLEQEQVPYAQIADDNIDIIDINQRMEDENRNDAEKIARYSAIIHEIMRDMSQLINDGGEQLIVAREFVEGADINVEDAVEQLTHARKSQASSVILKGTIGGIIIGLLIGGPGGAVTGYAIGHAVLGGAIIGGLSLGSIFGGVSNAIYRNKARNNV